MQKKTLVLGASPNPERYAYKAVVSLLQHEYEVVPVGIKPGVINGLEILTNRPPVTGVHSVSLYIGPANQPGWYGYIFSLNPNRIIFNPGTENPELEKMAAEKGITTIRACTLVLLTIGNY